MRPLVGCLFGTLAVLCLAGNEAQAQKKLKTKHPHLHHALFELQAAHHALKDANFDFGNLRQMAQLNIGNAIKQVDLALKNVGDVPAAVPSKRELKELAKLYPFHPHLHHALNELKGAHRQLLEAKHDYGGLREAALRDVDAAIQQVAALLEQAKKAG